MRLIKQVATMLGAGGTVVPSIDGGGGAQEYTLTFPFPQDVYVFNPGPAMSPDYIFQHLRPDTCQQQTRSAYYVPPESALTMEDTISCATDEEVFFTPFTALL